MYLWWISSWKHAVEWWFKSDYEIQEWTAAILISKQNFANLNFGFTTLNDIVHNINIHYLYSNKIVRYTMKETKTYVWQSVRAGMHVFLRSPEISPQKICLQKNCPQKKSETLTSTSREPLGPELRIPTRVKLALRFAFGHLLSIRVWTYF